MYRIQTTCSHVWLDGYEPQIQDSMGRSKGVFNAENIVVNYHLSLYHRICNRDVEIDLILG